MICVVMHLLFGHKRRKKATEREKQKKIHTYLIMIIIVTVITIDDQIYTHCWRTPVAFHRGQHNIICESMEKENK